MNQPVAERNRNFTHLFHHLRSIGRKAEPGQVRPLLIGSLCAFLLLVLLPGLVLARPFHAEYVSSDPAPNSMLQKAPTTITIHFMENLNPQGSDIVVYDTDGKQVSTGPAQVDRADLKAMQVNIQPDKSEVYVVNWHNVSAVEGHHDTGSFRFFVGISSMLKGMLANSSNGSQSSMAGMSNTSNSQSSASNPSSDVPIWLAALIGVIGLAVGGGAAYVFMRQPAIQGRATTTNTVPPTKTHV